MANPVVGTAVCSCSFGAAPMILISLTHFIRKKGCLRLCWPKFELKEVVKSFKTGFATSIQYVFQFFTILICNRLLMSYSGELGVAVFDIVFNVALLTSSVYDAISMVIAKTLIKNHAQNRESPGDVFTHTNEQLCEGNDAGLFVTAWMGILEIDTGEFVFVNAGHNPPLLKRANGSFEWLKSHPGFVLAGMERLQLIRLPVIQDSEMTLGVFAQYIPANHRSTAFASESICVGVSFDGAACGAALCSPEGGKLYLRWIMVDPQARYCGVGTYLLRGLLGLARHEYKRPLNPLANCSAAYVRLVLLLYSSTFDRL